MGFSALLNINPLNSILLFVTVLVSILVSVSQRFAWLLGRRNILEQFSRAEVSIGCLHRGCETGRSFVTLVRAFASLSTQEGSIPIFTSENSKGDHLRFLASVKIAGCLGFATVERYAQKCKRRWTERGQVSASSRLDRGSARRQNAIAWVLHDSRDHCQHRNSSLPCNRQTDRVFFQGSWRGDWLPLSERQ